MPLGGRPSPFASNCPVQELIVEGCPLLTHHGLRAIAEASVEAGRPLLGALRVLNLSQSAGGWPVLGFVDPGWQLVFE